MDVIAPLKAAGVYIAFDSFPGQQILPASLLLISQIQIKQECPGQFSLWDVIRGTWQPTWTRGERARPQSLTPAFLSARLSTEDEWNSSK